MRTTLRLEFDSVMVLSHPQMSSKGQNPPFPSKASLIFEVVATMDPMELEALHVVTPHPTFSR